MRPPAAPPAPHRWAAAIAVGLAFFFLSAYLYRSTVVTVSPAERSLLSPHIWADAYHAFQLPQTFAAVGWLAACLGLGRGRNPGLVLASAAALWLGGVFLVDQTIYRPPPPLVHGGGVRFEHAHGLTVFDPLDPAGSALRTAGLTLALAAVAAGTALRLTGTGLAGIGRTRLLGLAAGSGLLAAGMVGFGAGRVASVLITYDPATGAGSAAAAWSAGVPLWSGAMLLAAGSAVVVRATFPAAGGRALAALGVAVFLATGPMTAGTVLQESSGTGPDGAWRGVATTGSALPIGDGGLVALATAAAFVLPWAAVAAALGRRPDPRGAGQAARRAAGR